MSRIIVTAFVVAALGLSACGRKGPLAPPPGSASLQADIIEAGAV